MVRLEILTRSCRSLAPAYVISGKSVTCHKARMRLDRLLQRVSAMDWLNAVGLSLFLLRKIPLSCLAGACHRMQCRVWNWFCWADGGGVPGWTLVAEDTKRHWNMCRILPFGEVRGMISNSSSHCVGRLAESIRYETWYNSINLVYFFGSLP